MVTETFGLALEFFDGDVEDTSELSLLSKWLSDASTERERLRSPFLRSGQWKLFFARALGASSPEVHPEKTASHEGVFSEVAQAAELGAPIERSYELRHEVKDEPPAVVNGDEPVEEAEVGSTAKLVPNGKKVIQTHEGPADTDNTHAASSGSGTVFDPSIGIYNNASWAIIAGLILGIIVLLFLALF